MTATNDFERSITYGESALTYLKSNRTPAYPRNYELWYTYAAGFNRELNRAINDSLKRLGRLTPELTERYYDEFLSPVRLSDRVGEVSSQVVAELSGIMNLLESSGDEFGQYGRSLRHANAGIAEAESLDDVRDTLQAMIASTTEMERRNAELEGRIKSSQRQIKSLQENLEAIRYESLTDQLTGLANRKHFDQSLERAIETAIRRGEVMSLVMCDIDHFKLFNDTFGHQTGDQVLRLVGSAIKSTVKGKDVAARYGGEEFAIVLAGAGVAQGVIVADQIRKAVMAKELVKRSTGESLGRITMSMGVAELRAGDTAETLIERADACLYTSKKNGRNCTTDENDTQLAARGAQVA